MTKKQIKITILSLMGLQLVYSGNTKKFYPQGKTGNTSKSWLLNMLFRSSRDWSIEGLTKFLRAYYWAKAHATRKSSSIPAPENRLAELEDNVNHWRECVEDHEKQLNEFAQKQATERLELLESIESMQSITEFTTQKEIDYRAHTSIEKQADLLSSHKREWDSMMKTHHFDRQELRKAFKELNAEKRRVRDAYCHGLYLVRKDYMRGAGREGGRRRRK